VSFPCPPCCRFWWVCAERVAGCTPTAGRRQKGVLPTPRGRRRAQVIAPAADSGITGYAAAVVAALMARDRHSRSGRVAARGLLLMMSMGMSRGASARRIREQVPDACVLSVSSVESRSLRQFPSLHARGRNRCIRCAARRSPGPTPRLSWQRRTGSRPGAIPSKKRDARPAPATDRLGIARNQVLRRVPIVRAD
jgi:hypothetical protein